MAQTRAFRTQLNQQPSLFCARKTADQATGSSGSLTTVTWNTVEEWRGETNFSVSGNSWTAPSDGWLDTGVTLGVIGGANADDSMSWGFTLNGTWVAVNSDDWYQFSKGSGIEYPTSAYGAFRVSAGDVILVQFSGQQHAMTIQGASPYGAVWTGRFTPYIK